jgi:protein-S-isoprenylcysteine O-methyltransferase Ste14
LFRHRTSLPLPIAAAILLVPSGETQGGAVTILTGVALTAIGETIRLWGVHHIGVISRTRSERLGPLVDTGPFAYVRNPLYVGNILIWVGFAVTAGLLWLGPIVFALLAVEYHWIVKWEETLLASRMGDQYGDYVTRVPRWLPSLTAVRPRSDLSQTAVRPRSDLGQTLFSERGTLLAIAAGYLLLWLKARF